MKHVGRKKAHGAIRNLEKDAKPKGTKRPNAQNSVIVDIFSHNTSDDHRRSSKIESLAGEPTCIECLPSRKEQITLEFSNCNKIVEGQNDVCNKNALANNILHMDHTNKMSLEFKHSKVTGKVTNEEADALYKEKGRASGNTTEKTLKSENSNGNNVREQKDALELRRIFEDNKGVKDPISSAKELFDKQIYANLKMISKYIKKKQGKKQPSYAKIHAGLSNIHGIGIFADEHIKSGRIIIEYVGEIIGKKMADKRENFYKENNILSIYLFKIFDDLIIDATLKGNLARFVNHCCHPNATSRILNGRIFIYAIHEIRKDEEITFYYNFSTDDNDDMPLPCYCGHELCTKFIV